MHNNKSLLIAVVFTVSRIFFWQGYTSYAQMTGQSRRLPVRINESLPDYYKRWSSQPWQGDDKPFERVKVLVDENLAHSPDKKTAVAQYKVIAQAMPNDAIAQFRWAYALFQTYKNDPSKDQYFNTAIYPLAQLTSTFNYEFIRLRFLLEQSGPMPDCLGDLAIRLLAKNPKDTDVHIVGVRVLLNSNDISLRRQSVVLAEKMLSETPNDLLVQREMALVYEMSCIRDNNIDHGKKAIALYETVVKNTSDPNQVKYYNWVLKKTRERVERLSKVKG